ncbi:MAG: bifunctional biotin--[acetyl-CoA-carboxylase] ligase/biotin operon repressor BirA [Marinagarivorans sp.]|nr:bifunctional biotin--[acetyl-CoA-carboxylase] ligase/biotin operon repressor BirA [Marinagarivorans sp.]
MAAIPWPLLALLADGECHSGEALGDKLGVSRAAIWKMIQQLQAQGVAVESIRGQGYCIRKGMDLLDRSQILAGLTSAAQARLGVLEVQTQITSTNSALLNGAYGNGAVILAEQQTAGRGRRGRAWVSPLGANIYCSIRWHFSMGIACLEGLSLAVGVALVDALAELGVADVMLKWPNDLWLKGKKLGGVLVEVGGDALGECYAVVGVGLNIAMPKNAALEIDQAWTDLASEGCSCSRNRVVAAMINHLLLLLGDYQAQGFGAYRERWLASNALADTWVAVTGAEQKTGRVIGLNDSGALLLQSDAGIEIISGGEVSVRACDH